MVNYLWELMVISLLWQNKQQVPDSLQKLIMVTCTTVDTENKNWIALTSNGAITYYRVMVLY